MKSIKLNSFEAVVFAMVRIMAKRHWCMADFPPMSAVPMKCLLIADDSESGDILDGALGIVILFTTF